MRKSVEVRASDVRLRYYQVQAYMMRDKKSTEDQALGHAAAMVGMHLDLY